LRVGAERRDELARDVRFGQREEFRGALVGDVSLGEEFTRGLALVRRIEDGLDHGVHLLREIVGALVEGERVEFFLDSVQEFEIHVLVFSYRKIVDSIYTIFRKTFYKLLFLKK